MKLLTLGGLSVEGADYRREKPLLLLAYLTLEGAQTRRHLAELFWPGAANPMNSLAQNVIRLRPLGDVVCENGKWVEPRLDCDAADFRGHHRAGRIEGATTAYRGAFLYGVRDGLNPDLEEWVLDTRTALGAEARAAHLALADHHHARGESDRAALHAELAYSVPGADPIDPDDIPRVWRLLGRADHPLAVTLRREATDFGLTLPAAPSPVPATVSILGRAAELAQLRALRPGQVAWISGPPGIGKTALLGALAGGGGWRVLPGLNGLPLGTLEPLSPHPLGSAADALNVLRDTRLSVAIDGWEDCDDTTRAALTLAARQHPGATVVITARQPPAVPVETHLPLHPLSETELESRPGAHAATGGHPILLTAFLSGTPPERTLDAHLTLLGDVPRRVFLALAAQDTPHLNATRAALSVGAADLAQSLDRLIREGLTTPDGHIRATTPARGLLDTHPLDTALLHLHLARAHPKDSAWPHWLKAKDLWEGTDEEVCAAAAHWYADQEMKRGYPAKAARTLEVAPQTDEVKLLRGWALIEVGRAQEALHMTSALPSSDESHAIRATAHVYCGQSGPARVLAQDIPPSLTSAYAHAQTVLGYAAQHDGNDRAAQLYFKAAANTWHLLGEEKRQLDLTIRVATIDCLERHAPLTVFDELLERADAPVLRGMVLLNSAHVHHRQGHLGQALTLGEQAEAIYRNIGDSVGLSNALNTQAVIHHLQERLIVATPLYREAMTLARQTGHVRLIGMIAGNLAEIEQHEEQFGQIIEFLRQVGHHDQADQLTRRVRPAAFQTQETILS